MLRKNVFLIIIDYYDSLVRQVDIYTEEMLKIYTSDQLIEIKVEENGDNQIQDSDEFNLDTATNLLCVEIQEKAFSSVLIQKRSISEFAIKIAWPQKKPFEIGAQDYLNFIRNEMIKQIKIAEKETLEYLKTIKDEFIQDDEFKDEELMRKLFSKGSAYIFSSPNSNKSNPFMLYLVFLDFYLDQSQQKILNSHFTLNSKDYDGSPIVFDQERLFVSLLAENLQNIRPEMNENIFKMTKQEIFSMEKITIPLNNVRFKKIEIELSLENSSSLKEQKRDNSSFKIKNLKINVFNVNVNGLDCLQNLEYLYLFTPNIGLELFCNLQNLRKLVIFYCRNEHEEKWGSYGNPFKNLVNLEYLQVQTDRYFNLNMNTMVNLKWLHLEGCDITRKMIESIKSQKISVIIFKRCRFFAKIFVDNYSSLRAFDLSESDYMETTIFSKETNRKESSNLEELSFDVFSTTNLDEFREENVYLPKLTKLYLNLKQEILNSEMFNHLKKIKTLRLKSYNKYENLPILLFSPLECLEKLFIRMEIKEILANTFGDLNKLKKLRLRIRLWSNQTNKPAIFSSGAFANLNQLKELNLSNNNIEQLKRGLFSPLSSLEILDLNSNKLTLIEDVNVFEGLEKLEILYLGANKIKFIIKDAFKGLENLKILDLSSNKIEELSSDAFVYLKELRELDLSCNTFKTVYQCFSPLVFVESLVLRRNEIEQTEEDAFKNLRHLRRLYLENNSRKLQNNIKLSVFRDLTSLEYFSLDEFNENQDRKKEFKSFFGKVISFQNLDESR